MDKLVKQANDMLAGLGARAEEVRRQNQHKITRPEDLDVIPEKPGCYWIETTMPISKIRKSRVRKTAPPDGAQLIRKKKGQFFIVYVGTESNIRRRLKQHLFSYGHEKTVKLGLKLHMPPHSQYEWYVTYVVIEDPVLRYAVESWWRLNIGWPPLCRR